MIQEAHLWNASADADRDPGRALTGAGHGPHGLLDNPILQRMKGQHYQTSPGTKHAGHFHQDTAERLKFIIDRNPEGLERAPGAVARILVPHSPRNGRIHAGNQIPGGSKRLLLPVLHNDICNPGRPLFLAVFPENPCNLFLGPGVNDGFRAQLCALVHPHVQRRTDMIGKTSLCRIQLMGTDSEVEEKAVHFFHID